MKEVTKKDVENLLSAIDNEGFDYCFVNLSSWEEFEDTELGELIKDYIDAHNELDSKIKELAEKFEVEY